MLIKTNTTNDSDKRLVLRKDSETNRIYGELNLGIVIKSRQELNRLKSLLDETGLGVELLLKLLDGSKIKAEVLDVQADWEEF